MANPVIQLNTSRTIQSTGYGRQCKATHVGSNKIVAVYGHLNTVYARCGTKNGSEISWGTQVTLSTGGINASVKALTDSLIVVTWRDSGSPYTQRVRAATISGTTLTFGSAVATGATSGDQIGICRISDTHFGLTYHISPTNYVRAGSVSGTTITLGTQQSLGNHSSIAVDITCLDDGATLLPIYRTGSSDIEIKKCSVSGTAVTVSGTTQTVSSEYQFCKIEALNSTQFITFTPYTTGFIRGRVQAGSWTGSAFSMGSAVEVTTNGYDDIDQQERASLWVDKSLGEFIAAWSNDTGVTYGNQTRLRAGSVDGSSAITLGPLSENAGSSRIHTGGTMMEDREAFLITAQLTNGLYYRYLTYGRSEDTFSGDSQIKSYNTDSVTFVKANDEYADKQNPTGLGGYSAASVELWVKFTQNPPTNQHMGILGRVDRNSANSNYALLWYNDSGQNRILWDVGGKSYYEPYSFTLNTWYHLAATYANPTNAFYRIYVNGTQVGSGSQNTGGASMGATGEYFSVGAWYDVTDYTLGAQVDEVRFWNAQISSTQINANMHTQIAPTTSNLVGYWRFNGDYNDLTTNANHLTPRNTPTFTGDVPFSTTIPGVFNGNSNLRPLPKRPVLIIT